MYGSWYAGSQASSWIFWWAFARLCRLTSTPHVGGGGLGRRRAGSAAGPSGRTAARARFLGSQDGRGRRGPRRSAGNAVRCPRHRVPRGTDHSGSPGRVWSQYETSLTGVLLSVGIPRVGRPGAPPSGDPLLRDEGGHGMSVSRGPSGGLLAVSGGPEVARARTMFLVDEPVAPGLVREPILA